MRRRTRRLSAVVGALGLAILWLVVNPKSYEEIFTKVENTGAEEGLGYAVVADATSVASATDVADVGEATSATEAGPLATEILEQLAVKGRAPKTGYRREEFYAGWPTVEGCDLRQRILKREFGDTAVLEGCTVVAGEFDEPYTGEHRVFTDRKELSKLQIDHVVALSDAWQKGAQYLDYETRNKIATDPLNLLAVDGAANNQKSDGDAATWLPANKKFHCQYVARQVSVKYKYALWVTEAEKQAISQVLLNCPNEPAVGVTGFGE